MIPTKDEITICFAHVAYQMGPQYAKRNRGIRHFHVSKREDLEARIGEADVVVISGLWKNDLLERAQKLKFIQSIGAGTDQFARDQLRARGIRLASARGVNARAVSEHAMSLILALARKLPEARDNQTKRVWRGMISDIPAREDELAGKTLFVVGTGPIGERLVRLAKAFDMQVAAFRKSPASGTAGADSVHALHELKDQLPSADFVALACPLTDDTRGIINAAALARMKPTAYLVNVARGPCVEETALAAALAEKRIAGAGIDVTAEEPLPAASPLWGLANAFITPHTAGETQRYEDNVLDILEDNLARLWRGETALRNQVV